MKGCTGKAPSEYTGAQMGYQGNFKGNVFIEIKQTNDGYEKRQVIRTQML
jgi:hypothetical protein